MTDALKVMPFSSMHLTCLQLLGEREMGEEVVLRKIQSLAGKDSLQAWLVQVVNYRLWWRLVC